MVLTLEEHVKIQQTLEKLFDIRLTISIGYGNSPFDANSESI